MRSLARCSVVLLATWLVAPGSAQGTVIQVTPADNWTKIEGAKAGDIVEIAPGTYQYRVMLSQTGTAASPIIIRAKDPANRPVWDLAGKAVSAWPGSYTAGDKGRGCWQVKGSNYIISGIVFKHCQDESSAGLRAVNCGPLTIRDCLFVGNTNGLTGSSENLLVEFSELYDNGKLTSGGNMTHNIYIYGGVFTLRYSYVHDSHEGQNFHLRARDAVLEYNWLARPDGYPGDLMSCNTLCGGTGTAPITQKMTLRGNVLIQGTPKNTSQIIALYNDEPGGSYDGTGESAAMELTLIGNTIIGNQTKSTDRLINLRNDSGVSTKAHLSNNILLKLGSIYEAASPSASNWSVDGQANWVTSGTGALTKLTATLTGSDPGFVNAAAKDYTLAASSPCLGKAASIAGLPDHEYFRDETVKLQYRLRPSAKDLGAFERGNSGAPVGPYGTPPAKPDAGVIKDAGVRDQAPPAKQDSKPPTKKDSRPPDQPDWARTEAGKPLVDGRAGNEAVTADRGTVDAPAADAPASDAGSRASIDDGCSCALAVEEPASRRWLLLLGALALCGLIGLRRRRGA